MLVSLVAVVALEAVVAAIPNASISVLPKL
jgi:hypothetical protein